MMTTDHSIRREYPVDSEAVQYQASELEGN
jgi:hypothetical protein